MATRSELVDTPHGRCLIVELGEGDDGPLVGDERAIAAALPALRRREFIAGRTALRSLLGEPVAIVPDDRGAPVLPAGWVGSISHKGERAAALVAPAGDGFVGLDIELAAPPRLPIEKRILTPREQDQIVEGRDVTLRFAIKEAIYKAVDPMVRRYVGFTEVELDVAADGTCAVHIVDGSRLPVVVEAWWRERDGLWLATARARRR
ncbi:MAG TPA: 4'-phosphopantetheinyl transferase superfamily protein [Kofleriaceae bacterium]